MSVESLLEELSSLSDPDLRADYLIETARRYSPPPPEIATAPFPVEARIPACESGVYIFGEPRSDGSLELYFAVENPHGISAKALAVLLQETLSGASQAEFEKLSPDIVEQLFGAQLTMGRDLGLRNMVAAAKGLAKSEKA